MEMARQYVAFHQKAGGYTALPGEGAYRNEKGWTDLAVGEHLIFSHRVNSYTKETFTEGLHTHGYYELLLYVGGDVEYVIDDRLLRPAPYTAIWFAPGQMHTARLRSPSRYERYVLYFSPSFFSFEGRVLPVTDFMERVGGSAMTLSEEAIGEAKAFFEKVEHTDGRANAYLPLLRASYLVAYFGLLSDPGLQQMRGDVVHDTMGDVKRYIDREYANIQTVSDIADAFYYSREHLSRRFGESFQISISEYLSKRRVTESLSLLAGMNVTDAAYAVGFRSLSSYIAAFERNVGCKPSEYKKRLRERRR
ncbi:MAG: helix-turn-helix transcriptional regulator [Clostridia bacterium]|nr:helix-turn-helix transcriptional regulator [Clostridia bacterium]